MAPAPTESESIDKPDTSARHIILRTIPSLSFSTPTHSIHVQLAFHAPALDKRYTMADTAVDTHSLAGTFGQRGSSPANSGRLVPHSPSRTSNDLISLSQSFVTKDDLDKYATKEDLEKYATKEDLKKEINALRQDVNEMKTSLQAIKDFLGIRSTPPRVPTPNPSGEPSSSGERSSSEPCSSPEPHTESDASDVRRDESSEERSHSDVRSFSVTHSLDHEQSFEEHAPSEAPSSTRLFSDASSSRAARSSPETRPSPEARSSPQPQPATEVHSSNSSSEEHPASQGHSSPKPVSVAGAYPSLEVHSSSTHSESPVIFAHPDTSSLPDLPVLFPVAPPSPTLHSPSLLSPVSPMDAATPSLHSKRSGSSLIDLFRRRSPSSGSRNPSTDNLAPPAEPAHALSPPSPTGTISSLRHQLSKPTLKLKNVFSGGKKAKHEASSSPKDDDVPPVPPPAQVKGPVAGPSTQAAAEASARARVLLLGQPIQPKRKET